MIIFMTYLYVFFIGVVLYPVFLHMKEIPFTPSGKLSEMDIPDVLMVLLLTSIVTITWPIILIYGGVCLLQKLFKVLDV